MAEADALDAALLLDDLLRLAGPALGEGELGLFGLVVGDALGAPAAPLAGIDDEKGVGLVQPVLPGQIAGQHHDAVAGVFVGLLDLLVGAVDGVGALDLVLQDLLCHSHSLEEAGVLVLFRVPHGVEEADGVAEAVLLAGIVVQIEGLDEVLINEPGLTLAYKAGAEHLPQQAEGRVRDAVGAGLAGLLMVVEHAKADVVHDAVEVIRHHEAAGYFNIRAEDLEQGSGEHVVGMELACVGKAVCGYFHRGFSSFSHAFCCTQYSTFPGGGQQKGAAA